MIEIPRDKVAGIADGVNGLVKLNNQSGDSWLKIARDIVDALPEARTVWEQIQNTVSQAQTEKPHKMTPPTYDDEEPKKTLEEKVEVVNNKERAENIFNQLIEQGEKYKMVLATMKGSTLFEMLKGKKEAIINKIETELSR